MKNTALLIEYDGTEFGGWQIQPNAPTIQEKIQNAFLALTGKPCNLIGAGRTDAGVHAAGQVANVLLDDDFPIPDEKIAIALNTKMPDGIRIKKVARVPEDFHARYDAVAREYEYSFHTDDSVFYRNFSTYFKYPIDEDLLFTIANLFIGEHDFTSFSKNNPATKSHVCRVEKCEWQKTDADKYKLTIRANRFVYGMVRSIVGAMLEVAAERKFPTDLIFCLQNPGRENYIKLAPPNGLVLRKVFYKQEIFKKNYKSK